MSPSIRHRSLVLGIARGVALPLALAVPIAASAGPAAGDWTAIEHAHPAGQESYFYDSWSDGTDVWAAGYREIPVGGVVEYRTWVQRCNIGTATCKLQNTLDLEAAPAFNTITAITGTSAHDVWIGGTGKQPFGQAGTLIEHFNGTNWSIVPTPIERGTVLGMSAIAPKDVWAVGNDNRAGITSLAMHWDGVAWTQIPVVVKGCARVFRLHEIDATGPRPIAVGQCFNESGDVISVVISYRDNRWRPEKIVGIDPTTFELTSINWTGRTAWAGGSTRPGQAVALRLRHHVWTSVETPDNAFVLAGVAGTPHDAWGVGSGWQNVMLTMHWDGQTWTNVPDLESGRFTDVVLEPSGKPWAVGTDDDLSVIERYDGPLRDPTG